MSMNRTCAISSREKFSGSPAIRAREASGRFQTALGKSRNNAGLVAHLAQQASQHPFEMKRSQELQVRRPSCDRLRQSPAAADLETPIDHAMKRDFVRKPALPFISREVPHR